MIQLKKETVSIPLDMVNEYSSMSYHNGLINAYYTICKSIQDGLSIDEIYALALRRKHIVQGKVEVMSKQLGIEDNGI